MMSRMRNPRSTVTALLTFFAVFLVLYLLLDSYFFFNITTTAKTAKQEKLAKIWVEKINLTVNKVGNITEKEMNLFEKLKSIQESCGDVCDTAITGVPGKYYEHIRKQVDCLALFSNADIDALSEFDDPPKTIPLAILSDFTHNGRWKIRDDYRDDSKGKSHQLIWTKANLEEQIKLFQEGKLAGGYGKEQVDAISSHLDNHVPVKDQTVLVIGSQTPWLEGILLSKGVRKITTFDYIKIKSEHPQIETVTPPELIQMFFVGHAKFDVVISFSSLEHSGLGRYGDLLNPWGDLIAMSRAWCLVKPEGLALIGVPTGPDIIGFNSHKIYGPLAYAHLFANWDQVFTTTNLTNYNENCYFCYQPLHVLRRLA